MSSSLANISKSKSITSKSIQFVSNLCVMPNRDKMWAVICKYLFPSVVLIDLSLPEIVKICQVSVREQGLDFWTI